MAKRNTPTAGAVQVASLKDAGYRFAMTGESRETIVRYVLERDPAFKDEISKETRAELSVGLVLRKHELMGEKFYRIGDGGTWMPLNEDQKGVQGAFAMTVNIAMSYTPSEFGKLRESDPQRHAVLRGLRDATSTYVSQTIGDMQRLAKRLAQGDKPRARSVNKDFVDAAKESLATLAKRVKTAAGKGDSGADPERFKRAEAAFWTAYNAD